MKEEGVVLAAEPNDEVAVAHPKASSLSIKKSRRLEDLGRDRRISLPKRRR